jgi:hypothetical protein
MTGNTVRTVQRAGIRASTPQIRFLLNGEQQDADFRDAVAVAFEHCAPVRQFPSWRGKRNYSGSYWSSKNAGHVGFESLYERTALMMLDRESTVTRISSQPMWIFWPDGSSPRSHAPDFFLRHNNGDGEIIDVRPKARIDETATQSFEATQQLCEQAGLAYRVISDLDSTLDQNLRFLSRYRNQEWTLPPTQFETIQRYSTLELSIRALIAILSANNQEARAPGWVYSLLWNAQIQADLRKPLSQDALVRITSSELR